jgi:hypothetical protein
MKIKCAMRKEWIDGLAINHSPTPLLEQEQMQALNAEKMESSSKINLKDVSWWITKVAQMRSILQAFINKVCLVCEEVLLMQVWCPPYWYLRNFLGMYKCKDFRVAKSSTSFFWQTLNNSNKLNVINFQLQKIYMLASDNNVKLNFLFFLSSNYDDCVKNGLDFNFYK